MRTIDFTKLYQEELTNRSNALKKLEKEYEKEVEEEKRKVSRIGTNIGVVIYDENPDIQTMQRTKSSTTAYTAATMSRLDYSKL